MIQGRGNSPSHWLGGSSDCVVCCWGKKETTQTLTSLKPPEKVPDFFFFLSKLKPQHAERNPSLAHCPRVVLASPDLAGEPRYPGASLHADEWSSQAAFDLWAERCQPSCGPCTTDTYLQHVTPDLQPPMCHKWEPLALPKKECSFLFSWGFCSSPDEAGDS